LFLRITQDRNLLSTLGYGGSPGWTRTYDLMIVNKPVSITDRFVLLDTFILMLY